MAGCIRASGLAAALLWIAFGLRTGDAWPPLGLCLLGMAVAVTLAVPRAGTWIVEALLAPSARAFTWGCAALAAGASAFVVHGWLRAMPLSIDASVYLLEARALSHGHFGMPAPTPMQAFSNHFLFEGPDHALYGVFPPGWPLAIVPFLWIGAPMLAGPVLAALLVVAQAGLGRALERATGDPNAELATRASLVLSLPSVARALETADLLSHALVAVLATVAMACAIDLRRRVDEETLLPKWRLLAIGACVAWAASARLLDGVVLGLMVSIALAWSRAPARAALWIVAGAGPFALLLLVEQRCATGAWLLPTQSFYFSRADWPPGCHRLGFGADVGCSVEHKGIVSQYGPAGYDRYQALRVMSARVSQAGRDLLSFPPLALLAFVPLVLSASAVDALALGFVVLLTAAYGLFYYGPSQFFGARHLFPAAPFLWLLTARGACALPLGPWARFDAARTRATALACLLLVAAGSAVRPWAATGTEVSTYQEARSDLRRTLATRGIDRAILKTPDPAAVAAAFDPWRDGDRFFVVDDGSGDVELRRAHPRLPVFISLAHDEVGALYAQRPPRGALVELERAWPSFVRPTGLGASRARRPSASGGAVLLLTHAQPGAEVRIPFETVIAGDYLVRVDGLRGPTSGHYDLELDGVALPDWQGYAPQVEVAHGKAAPRTLDAGRHVLVARCLGRDEASAGYDAELDSLVAVPHEGPSPGDDAP